MGNRASQDSENEFQEGMLEISDRGLGSFRLVSIRDIFKKPLLTTSESSSTTTEDLAERCPCKCHENSEEKDTLQKGVENCCLCNRPKITEPADGCCCQCHTAVQKQIMICCTCRRPVSTVISLDDNQSEKPPSEKLEDNSSDNRSNFQTIFSWIFQTDSGETINNSNENTPEQLPLQESRSSSVDSQLPEVSSEVLPSDSNDNGWGFRLWGGWTYRTTCEQSQRNPLPDISFEETSNCSSFHDLSEFPSEESSRDASTASWWDFHTITYWLYQTDAAKSQCDCSDESP